ncbi:hypothetical protein [Spiroplasma endosymbiont of Polydrusus pterygomalis]|uniref:hypothetical protein n=1 Tax=Spiroplasma endosymbiont of Polydrusus pterygomalis TaxID=3139327 RepID=UPI003CCB0F39
MKNYIEDIEKISLNILEDKVNTTILKEIIFDIKDNDNNRMIKWNEKNKIVQNQIL